MVVNNRVTGYSSIDEFDKQYCVPFNAWLRSYNSYKPCLAPFPRSLFSYVGTNMKKTHSDFCGEKKQIAFDHLKCLSPETKPTFRRTGLQVLHFADFISKLPETNQIIPTFCCAYQKLTKLFEKRLEKLCSSKGYKGAGTFLIEILMAVMEDTVDMMCGAYQGSGECQQSVMQQRVSTMIKQARNVTTASFKFQSPIEPLILILERMDDSLTID